VVSKLSVRLLVTSVLFALCIAVGLQGNASDKKPLKFEIKIMADGWDEAATEAGFRTEWSEDCHLGITAYTASTGGGVEVRSAYFATPEEANRYFEWNLGRAAKVIEQRRITNINGKHSERRAVVISKTKSWQLMLTGGSTFRVFTGSDRKILLEFEKQFIEPNLRKHSVSPK